MSSKTAIITGASRGLGKDMAINLARQGVDIVFSYHRNVAQAKEVISTINSIGPQAIAFPFDAKEPKNGSLFLQQVCDYLIQKNGSPNFDYLINNAGTGTFNHVENTTVEQFDEMMNIHLKSVYFLTQAALPFINDSGRIVNISSGLTRFSLPGMSAYAIMKTGIEAFTRYLAKELGQRKITVNTVAPGAIASDFAGGVNRDNKEKRQLIANITALGRVGEIEDIGGIISFLCSDNAGWINGQRIEASGGMML